VPIIDVVTRWNSTYDMVFRAIDYRQAIAGTIMMSEDQKLISLLLDNDDWSLMER
jgi:hypothetical protein